jgi:DNA-binding NarL/FixJ family response regulator
MRVLLVDDHSAIRHALIMLLRHEPDTEIVGEASDGETAIALLPQLRPDVVLIDGNLPGLSGIATARAILAQWPTVRVIGMSLGADPACVAGFGAAGAIAYVDKADAPEAIVAALRMVRAP